MQAQRELHLMRVYSFMHYKTLKELDEEPILFSAFRVWALIFRFFSKFRVRTFLLKGFKFWFIGGIGILINMGVLLSLVEVFELDYKIAGFVGICIAAFSNYVGNILIGNIKI